MASPFVHVELMTRDVDKAKAFYGALFDRELEDVPGMDYPIVKGVAGTLARGRAPGATAMKEVTEIPGMVWFGILADPLAR